MRRGAVVAAVLVAFAGSGVRADVFVLKEGDRVTGSIAGETKRSIVVKTAYGPLTIPRDRILRILKPDGTDRAFAVPSETLVAEATPPPPPPMRLVLTLGGASFWHAWEEKNPPEDTTVRFVVSLDEAPIATYSDSLVDPGEIEGAVLNAFGFNPAKGYEGANGAQVAAPQVQPGRVTLGIDLPGVAPGEHTLRLSYQVNDVSAAAPSWRDVSSTSVPVALKAGVPTVLRAQQDAGRVAFEGRGRKSMKRLDTFRLTVTPDAS